MLIRDLIAEVGQRIATRSARAEAEWIVGYCLGQPDGKTFTRTELQLRARDGVRPELVFQAREIATRRASGEPLQYILGEAWFGQHRYRVDRRVLIPRPETELLVEVASRILSSLESPVIWEVGVGSGIILGELLSKHAAARGVGTDVSAGALELARANLESLGLGVSARVELILSATPKEVLEPFSCERSGPPSLLVSNPPYLVQGSAELEDEVRDYEPSSALYAPDQDPLFFYRKMAESGQSPMLAEIAHERADQVEELWKEHGWNTTRHLDLTGRPRVIEGRKSDG